MLLKNNSLNNSAKSLASSIFRSVAGVLNGMANLCESSCRDVAGTIPCDKEVQDVLTYRDVISWISTNKPETDQTIKVAVLKEADRGRWKVTTVFLTSQHEPLLHSDGTPRGRAQRVKVLDSELDQYFGDRTMIIIE